MKVLPVSASATTPIDRSLSEDEQRVVSTFLDRITAAITS
jgi:hypothetical protein